MNYIYIFIYIIWCFDILGWGYMYMYVRVVGCWMYDYYSVRVSESMLSDCDRVMNWDYLELVGRGNHVFTFKGLGIGLYVVCSVLLYYYYK